MSQLSPQAAARLRNVQLVLVRPRFPENIGAAARVVANMGLGGLSLVAPENLEAGPMSALATRLGQGVLETMSVHPDLDDALARVQFAAATTARISSGGRRRIVTDTPRELARQLAPGLGRQRAAVVFGPEDRGLENHEVARCQALVKIPTTSAGSLNLAQAVVIVAYELFLAATDRDLPAGDGPPLAERGQVEAFYTDLQRILIDVGAIDPANPGYFFLPVRRIFDRAGLEPQEVRMWRGVVRRLNYALSRGKPGD